MFEATGRPEPASGGRMLEAARLGWSKVALQKVFSKKVVILRLNQVICIHTYIHTYIYNNIYVQSNHVRTTRRIRLGTLHYIRGRDGSCYGPSIIK